MKIANYTFPKATWPKQEGEFIIPVEILEERSVFGRIDLRISPVGGSGSKWVNEGSVRREETP